MSQLKAKLPTDTWVVATWDEYIQMIENPAYKKAKGYYRNEQMRIETVAVCSAHASDNTIITLLLLLKLLVITEVGGLLNLRFYRD